MPPRAEAFGSFSTVAAASAPDDTLSATLPILSLIDPSGPIAPVTADSAPAPLDTSASGSFAFAASASSPGTPAIAPTAPLAFAEISAPSGPAAATIPPSPLAPRRAVTSSPDAPRVTMSSPVFATS